MRRGGHRRRKVITIEPDPVVWQEPPDTSNQPLTSDTPPENGEQHHGKLAIFQTLVRHHGIDEAITHYTLEELRILALRNGVKLGNARLPVTIAKRLCAT